MKLTERTTYILCAVMTVAALAFRFYDIWQGNHP